MADARKPLRYTGWLEVLALGAIVTWVACATPAGGADSLGALKPAATFRGAFGETVASDVRESGELATLHARFAGNDTGVSVRTWAFDGTPPQFVDDIEVTDQQRQHLRADAPVTLQTVGSEAFFVGVPGLARVTTRAGDRSDWRVDREFARWFDHDVDVDEGQVRLLYETKSGADGKDAGATIVETFGLAGGKRRWAEAIELRDATERAWMDGKYVVEDTADGVRVHERQSVRDHKSEWHVEELEGGDISVSMVEFLGDSTAYLVADDVYRVDLAEARIVDTLGACNREASLYDHDLGEDIREMRRVWPGYTDSREKAPCDRGLGRWRGGRARVDFFNRGDGPPKPWLLLEDRFVNLEDGRTIPFEPCAGLSADLKAACPNDRLNSFRATLERCGDRQICEDVTVTEVVEATDDRLVVAGSYFPGRGRFNRSRTDRYRRSEPGFVTAVDPGSGQIRRSYANTSGVRDLSFGPDGRFVVTAHASRRHALRVMEPDGWSLEQSLPSSGVEYVDHHPEWGLVTYGKLGPPNETGGDPMPVPTGIFRWEPPRYALVERLPLLSLIDPDVVSAERLAADHVSDASPFRVTFPSSPRGDELAGMMAEPPVRHSAFGNHFAILDDSDELVAVDDRVCAADGLVASTADDGRAVEVWNGSNGAIAARLEMDEGVEVSQTAFEPETCRLLVVVRGREARDEEPARSLQVWDAASGERLARVTAPPKPVSAVAGLPRGVGWVVFTDGGAGFVLSSRLRTIVGRLQPMDTVVSAVAIDEERHRMATGGHDGRLDLWELPPWKRLADAPTLADTDERWSARRNVDGVGLHACPRTTGLTSTLGTLADLEPYAAAGAAVERVIDSTLLRNTYAGTGGADDETSDRPGVWVSGIDHRRGYEDAQYVELYLRMERREILPVDVPEDWQLEIPCELTLKIPQSVLMARGKGGSGRLEVVSRIRVRRGTGPWQSVTGEVVYRPEEQKVVFETSETDFVWED